MTPLVVAHRTCPYDVSENSLAGIAFAATLDVDAVEIDVRVTRDGVPILMHDRTLWRTTRRLRFVRHATAREIAMLSLHGGEEPPPTFAAALDALPAGLRLAIEIKSPSATGALLAEIANRRAEDRVLCWAESSRAVAQCVAHRPRIETALLRDTWTNRATLRVLDRAVRLGAQAVSVSWRQVTQSVRDDAKQRSLIVYSYAKRRRIDLDRLALVDGVITDWPQIIRSVVGKQTDVQSAAVDGASDT